jgi:hypothetical protein
MFLVHEKTTKRIKKSIKPVLGQYGPALEVRLPQTVLDALGDTDTLELELLDANGNRRQVKPFFPSQIPLQLFCLEDRDKMLESYGVMR